MDRSPRTVKGTWEIGLLTVPYRLRPPTARLVSHEGRDLRSGAPVEVVLLRPPWDREAGVRRGFLAGVARLATLDHPNIARVLGVIDEDDLVGYVTEPVPGESIYQHLTHSATIFTEAEVVRIIAAIADGLKHAHGRGVVFANLKPTNVRLGPGGAVKLFALPKEQFTFTSFLDANWYLGHAVYHAPEFLRCEPLDERTDVYGLGITAYEMTASRLPGSATGNLGRDLQLVASQEWPAPAEIVDDIDPRLNALIVRCIHKDRARRYASVAAVVEDLQGVRGKPRCLISAQRLEEIVTTAFPTPLATLARALARDDHLVAQKDRLLNQANGLIGYLGFLAAHSLGLEPAERLARPALGHWAGLIGEALHSARAGWPFSDFRSLIANHADFLACLGDVVHRRNEVGHGAAPEEGPALHDWVRQTGALVRQLYKSLLFLTRYTLVSVEDLDYVGGQFALSLRRLEGAATVGLPVRVTLPQPCSKGKVYFASADFSRLVCLEPFVVLADCPLCAQRELFFYVSTHGRERRYVTPDRGHGWSCPT